jgi:hypothetical protein
VAVENSGHDHIRVAKYNNQQKELIEEKNTYRSWNMNWIRLWREGRSRGRGKNRGRGMNWGRGMN